MKKILNALEGLKGKKIDHRLVREALNSLDLKKDISYKEYLKGVNTNEYNRILIAEDPMQVFLMTWPPQFFLPIHQHNNFWGFVIPVEGIVSETIYGYDELKKKVFVHPTKTFNTGEVIYEAFNVIHKLQNSSPLETSVTLHIYHPPIYNYQDTKIFDAKNRRLGILNEKSSMISWDLPKDHYKLIEEDAYEVEKLW